MKISSFVLRICICVFVAGCQVPAGSAVALPGGPTPQLVKNINTVVSVGSNAQAYMQAGALTYFFITNREGEAGLWKTDGTQAGTAQMTHLSQTICSRLQMTTKDGRILLPLDDSAVGGTMGCELWSVGMSWPQAYLPVVVR